MMRMRFLNFMFIFLACVAVRAATLEQQFAAPPPEARPWVYWFWMNGNISKQGITADLEAMKRVGIGGVIFMEVGLMTPPGPMRFFSPPWRELFAHAVAEARRLGLKVTLNAGPGWTGSGGPWVKVEQSMQKVVTSETTITGGRRFEGVLPRPPAFQDFYRDIAVLAFPSPARGARVADLDEKALYKRGYYSSQPNVREAIPIEASYPEPPPAQTIPLEGIVDLSDKMDANGRLAWDVPPGDWTILRAGRTSTGQTNRPAPLIGLECDKMDPAALDAHFAEFIDKILADCGQSQPPANKTAGLTALHIDSWEVGPQNWTAAFREEFRSRRGYDPAPWLPALTGRVVRSLDATERFLWDLRQTASELVVQNYARHMRELAHRRGLELSIEPYDGNPVGDLFLGASADVPMCEFWSDHFDTRYSVTEAVSIGHVYGRPIIAAEAFTSAFKDGWSNHPALLKPLGDWAFSQGVNRFVVHRYCHQPWDWAKPGFTLGPHGQYYERTNTWWELTGPWHEYLSRCQYMLRQGRPVADLLILNTEGAPNVFKAPAGLPEGYKFDACTPEALLERVSVRDGRLVLPDGTSYRVLMLPETAAMTPALARKIKALADAGAILAGGTKPAKSPSLENYPDCDREVQAVSKLLPPEATSHITETLKSNGILPDFQSDAPLRFAHRRTDTMDIYFVSNGDEKEIQAKCIFRAAGKPELWNPETGAITALPQYELKGDTTRVPLRFGPIESCFIVFRTGGADGPSAPARRLPSPSPDLKTIQTIEGPWTVSFPPGLGAPPEITLDKLISWTGHPDPGVKYFSGTAVYKKSFEIPQSALSTSHPAILLDLGRVAVIAQLKLNGRDLGILWKPPFRADVGGALQPGPNALEVRVTNLWCNRMIGDEQLPEDSPRVGRAGLKEFPQWVLNGQPSPTGRITFTTYRIWKKDSPLQESGLLGPVTLTSGVHP